MLWLIFLILISPAYGVCNICFGDAQGCSGAPDDCPWKIAVAANVAAIVGGGATLIKLDNLLPPRYLRIFTRPVLQTLGIISSKPKGGSSFVLHGKDGKSIYESDVGASYAHRLLRLLQRLHAGHRKACMSVEAWVRVRVRVRAGLRAARPGSA